MRVDKFALEWLVAGELVAEEKSVVKECVGLVVLVVERLLCFAVFEALEFELFFRGLVVWVRWCWCWQVGIGVCWFAGGRGWVTVFCSGLVQLEAFVRIIGFTEM